MKFRRPVGGLIGYQKTSVADIACERGMSPANVYRFFPSRAAINESICSRVVNEVAEITFTIARTNAPALEKFDRLLTAVHRHKKTKLVKEKRMHDMIVAAMQENWATIKAHIERMVTIFEAIIREHRSGRIQGRRSRGSGACGQNRVHALLPSDSDRALRSTRRRHRSGPARADSLYPENSRKSN
jgi:AcrR family transcriptional regulator